MKIDFESQILAVFEKSIDKIQQFSLGMLILCQKYTYMILYSLVRNLTTNTAIMVKAMLDYPTI